MFELTQRMVLRLALAATASVVMTGAVRADVYPNKPIKLIVPWAAGAPGDIAGRVLADRMSIAMKQPIVIENKPGASGTIGYTEVLRQPADGYTLFMLSSATLVAPLLYPKQSFEFTKTLEPIGNTHWNYNVLTTAVNSPLKTPKDIVTSAKADPSTMSFGSGGNGTPAHFAGAMFSLQADIHPQHIPYVQLPMAVTDLMVGRLQYMFLTSSLAIPQIAGNKLRPMAVTSTKRLAALPDVPTMAELGFPQFVLRSFEGLTVRAGTPKPIVERLNQELVKALMLPEVKEKFTPMGWEIEPMTPEQFGKVIATESAKWMKLGKDMGLKAD